jgi:hypothetical protein
MESNIVLNQIKGFLKTDPYLGNIEDIAKEVHHMKKLDRNQLTLICFSTLNNINFRKSEHLRIACVKILIALVPDSTKFILDLINMQSGKFNYEVHFSLFCYLDEVPYLPNGKEFAKDIPKIIETYLSQTKSDISHAAFMACDLLGEHWDIDESLPVLMRIAKLGKYVAGRKNAIFRLGYLLNRIGKLDPKRELISSLLNDIIKQDHSQFIRELARTIKEGTFT